jgi:hypothetical protein
MMNQIPNPRAEIDDLSRVVSDALKQAKSGLTVSLSDLDDRANKLCQYLLSLPAPEARPYAAKLECLVDGLNLLEETISANFNVLSAGTGLPESLPHASK